MSQVIRTDPRSGGLRPGAGPDIDGARGDGASQPPAEEESAREQAFSVTGLHCSSCAAAVERGVGRVPGVEDCQLDFTSARLRVRGSAPTDAVMERIRELGYGGGPIAAAAAPRSSGASGEDSAPEPEAPDSVLSFLLGRKEARPAVLGGLLLIPGLIFHELLGWEALWIELPALAALLLAGPPVVRAAWRGLRVNRELNIQALMTIAVLGALVIGAWVEAGMVVVLFSIGEALEGYAATRARSAIQSLMTVAPDTAVRLTGRDADDEEVPVEELRPGDLILIRPGERLPMDGVVRVGSSTVDQAALTGESLPLDIEAGSDVLAGSVNGDGVLEVEVTRHATETTLHRMIRMVEEAQSRRVPVQRFIDRFARYYTPAVVALAVFVATVPPLVFGAPFWNPDPGTFGWFYRSLALLVVACPCALVISVPASVVSALTNAASSGVLIKGGAHLETLARVRAIAFDKTGTLTEGMLTVVGVRSVDCIPPEHASPEACQACDDLLALAAAVEQRSEHPVGRAVAKAAQDRLPEGSIPLATEHRALTGRGITALLSGRRVTIGSHRHFDLHVPHDGGHCQDADEHAREGRIPVLVEMEGQYLGTITLADVPRPSAARAIRDLREAGVLPVLLSGDSEHATRYLAERVGIDHVSANLLPEEKLSTIRAYQERFGSMAMVGDGINDAPALAAADVGIAVGGDLGGTDQAREAAAITLMRGDLRLVTRTLRLARATMRTVKANVAFAVGVKAIFLLLVLAGMGTLWMAVVADVGATLLVTLYGIRLLRWGQGDPPPIPDGHAAGRGDPQPTLT